MAEQTNGNGAAAVHVAPSAPLFPGAPAPPSGVPAEVLDAIHNHFAAATRGMVLNDVVSARSELWRKLFDPRRDIDDECGYPRSEGFRGGAGSIPPEFYRNLYDREGVATRVVHLMPKESWQVSPLVYEDEDSDNVTPFEEAWDNLARQLRGGGSWFQDEEGSPVWEHLLRADILSGIGHFGVLLLGIDDGKDLQEPVDGVLVANGMPDCPLLPAEEDYLTNLHAFPREFRVPGTKEVLTWTPPPLNPSERHYVTNQREYRSGCKDFCANAAARTANASSWPPSASRATDSKGKELFGTDLQYAWQQYSPQVGALSGTDQQYFGVQFGPSEMPGERPAPAGRRLLFLRAFDESLVQIVRYEWNVRSPRFGLPVMYRITLNDPREMHSGIGLPMATVFVHWSRLIHLADNLGSSEIFGVPRMRPVLNRLLDLRKLYGAGAEGYWKSCFTGLQFSTHPELGPDAIVDVSKLKDAVENYVNGLQRALISQGGKWETIAPSVIDPGPFIDKQVEAICIAIGVPVRVFKGSERGELASSQDDAAWNDRLRHRQRTYVTPRIIVPFIDRLILMGVLPAPAKGMKRPSLKTKAAVPATPPAPGGGAPAKPGGAPKPAAPNPFGGGAPKPAGKAPSFTTAARVTNQPPGPDTSGSNGNGSAGSPSSTPKKNVVKSPAGYSVEWPDLDSLTDKDKAGIFLQRVQAYAAYVSGQVETVIPPLELMTKFDQMTEEEAAAVLEATEKAHEDEDTLTTPPMISGRPAEAPPGTQDHADQEAKKAQAAQHVKALSDMKAAEGAKPASPVSVKAGEHLVAPDTGKVVAKGPAVPKSPAKPGK